MASLTCINAVQRREQRSPAVGSSRKTLRPVIAACGMSACAAAAPGARAVAARAIGSELASSRAHVTAAPNGRRSGAAMCIAGRGARSLRVRKRRGLCVAGSHSSSESDKLMLLHVMPSTRRRAYAWLGDTALRTAVGLLGVQAGLSAADMDAITRRCLCNAALRSDGVATATVREAAAGVAVVETREALAALLPAVRRAAPAVLAAVEAEVAQAAREARGQ